MAEGAGLSPDKCEFESHRAYQNNGPVAHVWLERAPYKGEGVGSIPTWSTNFKRSWASSLNGKASAF